MFTTRLAPPEGRFHTYIAESIGRVNRSEFMGHAPWTLLLTGVRPTLLTPPIDPAAIGLQGAGKMYDVEFSVFSGGTHASSYVSIPLVGADSTAGFDAQGWAHLTHVGVPLTAGAAVYPKITNGESGSRSYTGYIRIKRVQ